ncbi:DUF6443 domain-containing protein [uncultured Chryseobacterium sp.]|uniref:DUF6443 domain-containing protein n=1 Tax=uncultured Chryseobacterium sp. TaxID=259322 RepID=UPI0025FE1CA8|nr:DUF6443 domain-containing protein [uncultured Chryseobacterium sp.]
MRNSLLYACIFLLSGFLHGQLTNSENYIQSRTYLDSVSTSNSAAKQIQTVQYFDGLGRPKQVVNVKASPLGRDVVTHIEYDVFGRQTKDYLPVPQSGTLDGAIVPNPLANATQPNIYGSEKIYSEKILENSPLDRLFEQIQVGNEWSDKPVNFKYDTNTINDHVSNFVTITTWVNNATKSIVKTSNSLYFSAGQLYKNTVTDEDGNKIIEFKNGQGQVILVRKILSGTESSDTYYIYNEYNQLVFVLPPLASFNFLDGAGSDDEIPGNILDNLCYQYRYDGRSRLVEKKLPGKGWEYLIYDKADRLIMTQDAEMRKTSKWMISKYDQFGRIAYTGIIPGDSRSSMQSQADDFIIVENRNDAGFTRNGMQIYYTNNLFYQIETVLSVNYYDSYLPGDPFPTMIYDQVVLPSNVQQYGVSTKGLPVSSFVKNVEDDNWTKNYMYYDLKGRLIREFSQNHLGGYTNVEKRLDFSGVPSIILTQHKRLATDTERVITETFEYDNQNRLLVHRHKVDNNPEEILAQNTYNELSQLANKKVGGANTASPLQSIDYQYNIRGWMTKVNDPDNLGSDLFGYAIKYNNPEDTGLSLGRFNGNIAEIDWKTSTVANDNKRRYSFTYDKLNRLQQGIYSEPGSSLINNNNYNEQLTYDLNGNILTLKRFSKPYSGTTPELIDDLVYNYTGNRLDRITLPSGVSNNASGYNALQNNFSYDLNGNMTSHLDKGISSITYNYLNLPDEIKTDPNIIINNYKIGYKYRSDGQKLHKTYTYSQMDFMGGFETVELNTDYLDGFQYGQSQQFGSVLPLKLQFVPTSEGYFDFTKNKYIYNYVDHLGNVRLSYYSNGNSISVKETNYYPFGLKHQGYNNLTKNSFYQYSYNGKELQESGMYDYGARFYMPDIGRWGVHDPLSELQFAHSPYSYVYGNPIGFNDPTGMIGEPGEPRLDPNARGGDNNPDLIQEVVMTYNKPNSLSFMGIRDINAYHASEDRLAAAIRSSNAALATEKFERNLAFAMGTFMMGGSNIVASAGWATLDAYMSYQSEQAQEAVSTVQLAAMLVQVSHGNVSGIQKLVYVDASRINIAKGITRFTPLRLSGKPVSAGWKHVVEGHFNRPLANSRSVFSTTEEQLKSILQSKTVINSPITPLTGGQFQRTVDTGQIIGNAALKDGGVATSWINIITDYKGNLITTYPIAP